MAPKKQDINRSGALQMSFFTPESSWKPPALSDLPDFRNATRIALDAETKDSDLRDLGPGTRRDAFTVGWALAIEGGPKFYLPIRHQSGQNLPVEGVLGYLRDNFKDFKGDIVGANLGYDYDFACNDGIKFHSDAKFRDIQIADPLIYELHMNYSLKEIGKRNGFESKNEGKLEEAARSFGLDPKKGLWRLDPKYVGEYAESDVTSPLQIYENQRKVLTQDDLWQVYNMESDLLPVLIRMRQRGVRIDQTKLHEIERWAEREEQKALDVIYEMTGIRIGYGEVWKPGPLAPALEYIGIKLEKTSTGAPQIDRFLLGANKHPVTQAIQRARKVNKLRTTFAASIWRYLVNGRIHCTFHQIAREDDEGDQKGVRYGRLSAVDPNLQQQPSPDRDPEIAGEWRKIFIPEEGAIWGCNDYSQQEPRWTTHFAALLDFPRAKEAAQRYVQDPSTDNHDMMTRLIHGDEQVDAWYEFEKKVYKQYRGYSKNIFLGLCYGEGGAKLCRDIGLPTRWCLTIGYGARQQKFYADTRHELFIKRQELGGGYVKEVAGEEGQAILDKFDREVPYVRAVAKKATEQAESRGYVKTIMGRRLHFERREDGTYDYTHKALNRVIQGSSADQTKYAVIQLDRAGYFIQLQVHDETDGSYGSVKEAQEAGQIMRDCVKDFCSPLVPFKVDTEVGPSWGEIGAVE